MWRGRGLVFALMLAGLPAAGAAQTAVTPAQPPAPAVSSTERPPTRADILRGEYGRYRANNDLLFYHLDVRVDPVRKSITGTNAVRFRMLMDDTRIQLDLHPGLNVDRILFEGKPLKYRRELRALYIDFPTPLARDESYTIDVYYSGSPVEQGRFGCMAFRTDTAGRPWITMACEGEGASTWWPNKDQWRDEPDGMQISVAVPNGLRDVSNGRFLGSTDLGDGYTRWDWLVQYPINATYLESLYVEQRFGRDAAVRYVNGEKPKVKNQEPVITQRGIHREPTQDQYFKGALFLHTLRSVVNDDAKWETMLKDFYQRFKYRSILTEDVVQFFNAALQRDLTPIFNQYLQRAAIPVLELVFQDDGMLAYRWKTDERNFAMPVRAGAPGALQILEPTTDWKTMRSPAAKDVFEVATDLYYIDVHSFD
jgi:aminopeptidase N